MQLHIFLLQISFWNYLKMQVVFLKIQNRKVTKGFRVSKKLMTYLKNY